MKSIKSYSRDLVLCCLFLISCKQSTESEKFCADPCDIVSYGNRFGIQEVECMGNSVDYDQDWDNYGRIKHVLSIYENGSVEIDNVEYNMYGECLSYTIEVHWKSQVITKSVERTYENHQLVERICN